VQISWRHVLRTGRPSGYGAQEFISGTPSRLSFGRPALRIAMTVPVKKADTDRVRLFSSIQGSAAVHVTERVILQFGTQPCRQEFLPLPLA